jgi:hypothetical protein
MSIITGGKTPGNRGRSQQYLTEQLRRAGMIARGDGAHVPHYAHRHIEMGGGDQEQLSLLGVFAAYLGQQGRRDAGADKAPQRRRVVDRIAHQGDQPSTARHHVGGGDSGIDPLELLVVGSAEKGEGRDQGAGADAGNAHELRPCAERGPAGQKACTVGAVLAAAGNREIVSLSERPAAVAGAVDLPALRLDRDPTQQVVVLAVEHHAAIGGKARERSVDPQLFRQRGEPRGGVTSANGDRRARRDVS